MRSLLCPCPNIKRTPNVCTGYSTKHLMLKNKTHNNSRIAMKVKKFWIDYTDFPKLLKNSYWLHLNYMNRVSNCPINSCPKHQFYKYYPQPKKRVGGGEK